MGEANGSGPVRFEGAEILAEVPGKTGVLLWKTLRAVRVSAAGSDRERAAELFTPGARHHRDREITAAEVAGRLDPPLRRLTALLDPSESMGKERIAAACGEIATWARESGELATASAFSEVAARTSPGDASLAYQAYRAAEAKGDSRRAEEWCNQVVLLARRASDWALHAHAVLMLGYMARCRGNYPVARRTLLRAAQLGRRHGLADTPAQARTALTDTHGQALHVLFTIADESGDVAGAQRYATRAFRAYGACHPRIHLLSHDVYRFWLTQGQFARAFPALRKIYPLFEESERLTIAANLVRATAGVGDRRAFRRAWTDAVSTLEWRQTAGRVSDGLVAIAEGATGVGEWELARTMAERARAVGEEKGEWRVVFSAESVLRCVRERQSALPLAR